MAVKQFAIPLDEKSIQTGDTNFKALVNANEPVTFQMSNVTSGSTNELNLITNSNGVQVDHKYSTATSSGKATVGLTANQMAAVFADAAGDDWDYVEAYWTAGAVDTPAASNLYLIQSGKTYNLIGWPPNK